ncbi:unnamed protein product [Prorocentrum cordatum]|uniref:RING-type domain-containing protein n=1 Tax=Prorocentrum cordatum TaxID=2364126 RepID=A0ABN9VM17_9DINO|nr:unnamed protein product [Polarella glacialis]
MVVAFVGLLDAVATGLTAGRRLTEQSDGAREALEALMHSAREGSADPGATGAKPEGRGGALDTIGVDSADGRQMSADEVSIKDSPLAVCDRQSRKGNDGNAASSSAGNGGNAASILGAEVSAGAALQVQARVPARPGAAQTAPREGKQKARQQVRAAKRSGPLTVVAAPLHALSFAAPVSPGGRGWRAPAPLSGSTPDVYDGVACFFLADDGGGNGAEGLGSEGEEHTFDGCVVGAGAAWKQCVEGVPPCYVCVDMCLATVMWFTRQILCSGGAEGGGAAAAGTKSSCAAAAEPPARAAPGPHGQPGGAPAAAAAQVTQSRRHWVQDAVCQTVPVWEERDACVICLQAPRTHALSPCGHLCVCASCGGRQRAPAGAMAKCPLCRKAADCVFEVFAGFDLGIPRTPSAADRRGTRFRLVNRRVSPSNRPKLDLHNVAECLQEVALANTAKEVDGGSCAVADAWCQTLGHDLCVTCEVSQATHATVPCGHLCLCEGCAEGSALRAGPCPACSRLGVLRFLKIFS